MPQTGQSASDRPNSNINITSGGNEKTKIILATAGYDHTIRFWEALDGDCLGIIQHNESQVICMEGSQCKRFLAVGGHMSIRIYDLSKTFDEINELNLKKLSKIVKSQTTSISTVIPRVAAVPITKSVTNKQEMNNVNYETNFPDVNISNEELATTFKQKNAPMAHGSLIETLFTGYGNTVSLGFLHIDGQLIIWSVNEDGSIKMWKEENTFKCIKEFNLPLDGENHDKGMFP